MLLLKNTLKIALQYLFNVVILFNTIFNLQLNLKLEINQKICASNTWKKFKKPGRYFSKTSGNICYSPQTKVKLKHYDKN